MCAAAYSSHSASRCERVKGGGGTLPVFHEKQGNRPMCDIFGYILGLSLLRRDTTHKRPSALNVVKLSRSQLGYPSFSPPPLLPSAGPRGRPKTLMIAC